MAARRKSASRRTRSRTSKRAQNTTSLKRLAKAVDAELAQMTRIRQRLGADPRATKLARELKKLKAKVKELCPSPTQEIVWQMPKRK